MQKSAEIVVIVRRKQNAPLLFCRKSGGYSSLVTSDCVFNLQEAWHCINNRPCDIQRFETFVFKSISEGLSLIGLSPSEVAGQRAVLLSEYNKSHKSEKKEFLQNAKKKKKASVEDEKSERLFATVGEIWEIECGGGQPRDNRTFDIF